MKSKHDGDCAVWSAHLQLCDCGYGLQCMRDGGDTQVGNKHHARLAALRALIRAADALAAQPGHPRAREEYLTARAALGD